MKLAPGHTFGRYQIEAFIGQGGMGRVFRAQDTLLERPVALKVILPDQAKDPEAVPRFLREARLAAKLTHPNAVHLYDLGEVAGVPFMAMELIDGRSLQTFIGDTTVHPERKIRWMLGVARALAAAHQRKLIHRDVKPANVMVSPTDDSAKIVDFGLAKRLKTTPALRTTFQTQTGFVLGTPAYMAPEALAGEEPDERSDQFGWAITTHTVVAGRNPRSADPMLLAPIEMLSDVFPAVSRRVALVVMRALSNDPAMRFRSMGELADALAEAFLVGTLTPPPMLSLAPPVVPSVVPSIVPSSVPTVSRRTAPMKISTAPLPQQPSLSPVAHEAEVPGETTKRDQERQAVEADAVLCVERMRKQAARPLSFARAGHTHHKQSAALEGCPSPHDIKAERWAFRSSPPLDAVRRLRLAAIAPDGRSVFAVSVQGSDEVVLAGGTAGWRPFTIDGVRPREIKCACFLRDGRIAIGGREALAGIASFSGALEPWSLRGQLGNVVVDLRSTGDRSFDSTVFTAVDVRESAGVCELAFVGSRGDDGVVAVGRGGKLTPHASTACGPLVGVVFGKVVLVAGAQLGICTERAGIVKAVHGDRAHSLVRIDERSAVSLGASGCTYFSPLDVATWPELGLESARVVMAFAAERTRAYAIDQNGMLLRRSASWSWVPVSSDFRAKDPIAMWVGPSIVRIVCADGTMAVGTRAE